MRVHNRTGHTFTGDADNRILLRWTVSGNYHTWKTGWTSGTVCGQAQTGIAMNQPLGTVPAYGSAVYTADWVAPSFPGTLNCVTPDRFDLYMAAIAIDEGITVNLNAGNCPMEDFVRQNNNVAMRHFSLHNFDVYIEPLIPILGAPATLTGGSSEADAQLTWRGADGTVLPTPPQGRPRWPAAWHPPWRAPHCC